MAIGQKGWPGHYLSAYGIAQKRGFRGTEQEWLQSLHGADVEMQTEDGLLQWKKDNDADWKTLASFSDFTDGAVSRAEAAAREVMGEAVKNANEKAARAETAAGRADASAGKADAATDRANTAKAGADNAAQNAGEKAGEARQSATAANAAATAANDAAAAANGAAGTANSAAETARAQGDYAEAQGDVAKELTDKLKETDIGGMAADILALQSGKVDKTAMKTALAAKADQSTVTGVLAGKVDKAEGKGLSSNDYTAQEKEKLAAAGPGRRTCRFVVGTSTAGWTENDCDYLCDGVDDQVEINAALQALPEGGGEVKILDGTYSISAQVVVSKNQVTLSGNGSATMLVRAWQSTNSEGVIVVWASYCTVKNIFVDGVKNRLDSPNTCLLIRGSHNVVNHCGCIDNYQGCYLDGCHMTSITDNDFSGITENSIMIRSCADSLVKDNRCYSDSDRNGLGIYTTSGAGHIISENTCVGFQIAILLSGRNSETAMGNYCSNNDQCIMVSGTGKSLIGNICSSSSEGISCSGKNHNINNNVCLNDDCGISLSNCKNSVISGNTIVKGNGTSSDYDEMEYTIQLYSELNSNNLISSNIIAGKNYVCEGGTGNEFINNKFE